MKKISYLFLGLSLFGLSSCEEDYDEKPVLYFYPETSQEITARIDFEGEILFTYPESPEASWTFFAEPDGTLKIDGREYGYLFYEGVSKMNLEWESAFCVSQAELIPFLEDTLTLQGLNHFEQTDFITYWLPRLSQNEWNLIQFPNEAYREIAHLTITPEPDTLITVFMAFKGIDACPTDLIEPELIPQIREGYTVVEWGGTEIK